MFVKQLSIFIENKAGRLAELSELLANNGIDLRAISIADTKEFGIVRLIVSDLDKAVKILTDDGWVFKVTPVIAVKIPDESGRMADVLRVLTDENIGVEYIYAVISHNTKDACIIIRVVDKMGEKAVEALNSKGYEVYTPQQLSEL
ncbi:MAG TPA: acetolactate synthase [Ruminococcaceae bacterium]|nr:acetolactate synthase [Oscillospiraceae bacterium]